RADVRLTAPLAAAAAIGLAMAAGSGGHPGGLRAEGAGAPTAARGLRGLEPADRRARLRRPGAPGGRDRGHPGLRLHQARHAGVTRARLLHPHSLLAVTGACSTASSATIVLWGAFPADKLIRDSLLNVSRPVA